MVGRLVTSPAPSAQRSRHSCERAMPLAGTVASVRAPLVSPAPQAVPAPVLARASRSPCSKRLKGYSAHPDTPSSAVAHTVTNVAASAANAASRDDTSAIVPSPRTERYDRPARSENVRRPVHAAWHASAGTSSSGAAGLARPNRLCSATPPAAPPHDATSSPGLAAASDSSSTSLARLLVIAARRWRGCL